MEWLGRVVRALDLKAGALLEPFLTLRPFTKQGILSTFHKYWLFQTTWFIKPKICVSNELKLIGINLNLSCVRTCSVPPISIGIGYKGHAGMFSTALHTINHPF